MVTDKKNKNDFLDIFMAMSILLGGLMFPVLTLSLMFDNIGNKSLVLLIIIIPYYLGVYRFRQTWGFK